MFGPSIRIGRVLKEKLDKTAAARGYSSGEEFARHVLEEAARDVEEGGASEEEVRKRLQGLGYLS